MRDRVMTANGERREWPGFASLRDERFAAGVLLLMAIHVAVLLSFGQPFFAQTGHVMLWVGDIWSRDMSQQLTDWYSFSHIIHGFIFFGLLHLVAPRLPLWTRLLIAMGVEIAWEIAENSPAVIRHYRQQALAAGYTGDSILNSLSDVTMMTAGFLVAARIRARYTVALALAFELFTLGMIRDNLTLNVVNLVVPTDLPPLPAIHRWQAGAQR